jgi:hypothetical protein
MDSQLFFFGIAVALSSLCADSGGGRILGQSISSGLNREKPQMATLETIPNLSVADIPRGMNLVNQQLLNRGTAFTDKERAKFDLDGLLPPQIETLDEQVVRAYEAYQRKDNDLERHVYLRALQDTNEVLFYRLLLDHIGEMTPIVYTPAVQVPEHRPT